MLNIQGKTYITIAEASKLTGYHPSHIQKLATENKIEAAKIVRTWAVNQDSIIVFALLSVHDEPITPGVFGQLSLALQMP